MSRSADLFGPPAPTRGRPRRDVARRDLLITGGRALFVPALLLTLGRWPLATAALLIAFVVVDYLDGVIARRAQADQVGRRLLDTFVDRLAIYSCLVGAWAMGWLPLELLGLFAAREAVAGYFLLDLLRRDVVIRADSRYRGFNLSIASWGALAPVCAPMTRGITFAFVLALGTYVLADIIRAARLSHRGHLPGVGVIEAQAIRRAARRATERAEAAATPRAAG